jgi:hypothetical protein
LVETAKLKAFTGYISAVQQTLSDGRASEDSPYPTCDTLSNYQKMMAALKATIHLRAKIGRLVPG